MAMYLSSRNIGVGATESIVLANAVQTNVFHKLGRTIDGSAVDARSMAIQLAVP